MEETFWSHLWLLGAILSTLLFVLGVIGNSLTIIILAKNKSLRCPSARLISRQGVQIITILRAHFTIFSLSTTNLIVCLVLVPVMIFDFLNKSNWELSEELCSISSLVGYGNGPTSIMLIALLSLARYKERHLKSHLAIFLLFHYAN